MEYLDENTAQPEVSQSVCVCVCVCVLLEFLSKWSLEGGEGRVTESGDDTVADLTGSVDVTVAEARSGAGSAEQRLTRDDE